MAWAGISVPVGRADAGAVVAEGWAMAASARKTSVMGVGVGSAVAMVNSLFTTVPLGDSSKAVARA